MFIEAQANSPVQWIKVEEIIRLRVDSLGGGNSVLQAWVPGDSSSYGLYQGTTAAVETMRDSLLAILGNISL